MKLASGLAVLLVITGAMIQIYAMWAATPGTHPSPFFWSMTGLGLAVLACVSLCIWGRF